MSEEMVLFMRPGHQHDNKTEKDAGESNVFLHLLPILPFSQSILSLYFQQLFIQKYFPVTYPLPVTRLNVWFSINKAKRIESNVFIF